MRIRHRHIVLLSSFAFVVGCVAPRAFSQSPAPTASAHADPPTGTKQTINTEAELPRFSYPLKTPPSELFNADDGTFNAFAKKVVEDLHRTLQDCEITDNATRRGLLEPLFYLALLTGQDDTARQLLPQLQANQDKEELRLTTWRIDTAYLQAAQAAGAKAGPMFMQGFEAADRALTDALPWDTVQETLRQQYGIRKVVLANGTNVLTGLIKENIDPVYAKTGAVDLPSASRIIILPAVAKLELPLLGQDTPILKAYMDAHTTTRPDIWAARDVTLTGAQKLTPVAVGVWDDGVDPQVFKGRMFDLPGGTPETLHGLAFDDAGHPSAFWLYPLTPEQQASYPQQLDLARGMTDLQDNVESPAATHLTEVMSKLSPDQSKELFHTLSVLSNDYIHGTHVAGIATRGNPAARVAVFRFNDWLHEMPFQPSLEYVETMRKNFAAIGRYAAANHVRVVNISWGDTVAESEEWLSRQDANTDPAIRKQTAQALYQVWREGIQEAIRNAPDTLFCAAAGNSNQDAGFEEQVPASLVEPNLIAVGAVNQAGDPASFTSYCKTVAIYADGWDVVSSVSGGETERMS